MDSGAARGILRDIHTLYTRGTMGGRTDSELLERFLAGATATPRTRSRRWWPATGRWSWASAGGCSPPRTTRRTPSRRRSSSWRTGPGRSSAGIGWRAGSTASRCGPPRWPGAGRCGHAAERRLMDATRVESGPPEEDRQELLPILDEELNRLPQRYRTALVACELEGKSRREAARQLGIPEGTLSARLARGRTMLRDRMRRRGRRSGSGRSPGNSARSPSPRSPSGSSARSCGRPWPMGRVRPRWRRRSPRWRRGCCG